MSVLPSPLLKHPRTDTSRSHPFRIIGGDFNQLHTKPIFQDILMELDSSSRPGLAAQYENVALLVNLGFLQQRRTHSIGFLVCLRFCG